MINCSFFVLMSKMRVSSALSILYVSNALSILYVSTIIPILWSGGLAASSAIDASVRGSFELLPIV